MNEEAVYSQIEKEKKYIHDTHFAVHAKEFSTTTSATETVLDTNLHVTVTS